MPLSATTEPGDAAAMHPGWTEKKIMDPMKFHARGFRFVIRDGEASWLNPKDVRANDTDVTDLDSDAVAKVFVAKRAEHRAFLTK